MLLGLIAGLALAVFSYWTATRDPVVRETRVGLDGWPEGQRPLRVVLASDLHVQGPDMPPERLARIVEQINALRPDLVLLAGDFSGDRQLATRWYSYDEALAPLAGLRAPLGSVAVLGNHDHWRDPGAASRALVANGVRVLANDALRAGPLAVGGLDDDFTGRDDLPRTMERMRAVGGVPILLSHSPDPFPELPSEIGLMLAGHTHCGQIRLPLVGAITSESRHGSRYSCGRVDENGRTVIVSAGLGTSVLPFRLGAVPDLWLVEVGPRPSAPAH
ncbi:MAG: metallophosphoesterase [Allosphingosinicella sp.]|uniref:metallophosphoesterase n=1 Tax=Allosphingosinicella sp. TaxID=2823234 RepID=UPI003931A0A3